ncbi:eukaryotic aspartyl protease [Colletotrichum graminicola]|uniref:Eukaryotic aspartyl protease n=1 Tax=Colletotrichum graminicola (strain M1.001 / M2 / FGSC 10212) TaxID=645133 RepID=E3Q6W8_COLGM|nr:eukaryotic aspartyl protease [Colletotrichum graminicola M1.001]EFQ26606.1 eukaryotic aspartyl protease [Colletotrichum graminicola M1.001]WDK17912.1 eukaryotic aspartyl protease [Colletotrichum graminicola]
MRTGGIAAVVGGIVSSATALSLPSATEGKGYIAMPVRQTRLNLDHLTKRDAIEVVLKNREFYYSTDVIIGTPGQQVTVLLDTGSSELWVNPDCATAPSAAQAKQCSAAGQYNPRNSRTPPSGPTGTRRLNYGDPSAPNTQTSAEIAYYSDSITMGNGILSNQTFGVVTKSDGIATGIMGLAPDLKAGFAAGQPYSLVLNSLADQGIIGSRIFSLDLRHASSDSGALIYGGVDTGKFIGELLRVPMVNGAKGEPRLAVELTGVGMKLSNSAKTYNLAPEDRNVMIDSGTTLTRLHPSLARPILSDLKATSSSDGYWTAACSLRNSDSDTYVTFTFGRKTIRVPLSDFILDLGPSDDQCYIGLVTTTDQQILGDSMMRAGYFVFDWDNQFVHMAQASTCNQEKIVAVGKGSDAIPSGVIGLCQGPTTPDGEETLSASAVSPPASPAPAIPIFAPTVDPATVTKILDNSPAPAPTPIYVTLLSSCTALTLCPQPSTANGASPTSSYPAGGLSNGGSSTPSRNTGVSPSSAAPSDPPSAASSLTEGRLLCLLLGGLMTFAAVF